MTETRQVEQTETIQLRRRRPHRLLRWTLGGLLALLVVMTVIGWGVGARSSGGMTHRPPYVSPSGH